MVRTCFIFVYRGDKKYLRWWLIYFSGFIPITFLTGFYVSQVTHILKSHFFVYQHIQQIREKREHNNLFRKKQTSYWRGGGCSTSSSTGRCSKRILISWLCYYMYALSIYPSLHKQQIRTLLEARPVSYIGIFSSCQFVTTCCLLACSQKGGRFRHEIKIMFHIWF